MAKGIYPIVNGVTKKTKKAYTIVDGYTKKVKKIYTIVGGVSRLAWTSSIGFFIFGGHSVSYNRTFATIKSGDGATWTYQAGANYGTSSYPTILMSAYGNGTVVAIGASHCFYTKDGINFTEISALASQQLRWVCYGGDRFVAVGDYGTWYSLDGVSWTKSSYTPGYRPQTVCYDYVNNKFVAACIASSGGTSGCYVMYSVDGATWTHFSGYTSNVTSVTSICFNGSWFFAAQNGKMVRFQVNWSQNNPSLTTTLHTQSGLQKMFQIDGEVFGVGYLASPGGCWKWSPVSNTFETFNTNLPGGYTYYQIIKVDGVYYMIGRSGDSSYLYRRDSATSNWYWVQDYIANGGTYFQYNTICYGGD